MCDVSVTASRSKLHAREDEILLLNRKVDALESKLRLAEQEVESQHARFKVYEDLQEKASETERRNQEVRSCDFLLQSLFCFAYSQ